MTMRRLHRFVEKLLNGGRPRPFPADDADADALRVAIELRAARPGSGAPREEFIAGLHRRLARDQADAAPVPVRRRILVGGAVGAAGAAAGVFADRMIVGPPAAVPAAERLTPDIGAWHPVVNAADVAEGAVHGFSAGGVDGFLTRDGGRLRAVSGTCTHQGCRLGVHERTKLRCPCHGALFALDGEVLYHRLKAPIPALPRLAIRQRNGVVEVFVPQGPA
ncbi:Rieske (2Fe-2S) protein [Actinomadura syzygii]|uniref:Rieske (2Fe-2S) protein n=2 Tax=Actinomadura syzygii TaxID=1427538 RepID=A0A5D0U9Z2_9ACTN|nr:Rieske (2Fe-2S) protein [Actinomadura syzygii]